MSNNKTFQLAIIVSIVVHSILFMGLPRMSFLPSMRPLENLKIVYCKIKEEPKIEKKLEPIVNKLPDIKKEEIFEPPKAPPLKYNKPEPKPVTKSDSQVQVEQVEKVKVEEKKFERVIEEEKDDAKRATYISYYRAVREKIKRSANQLYPKNRYLGEGEVVLSFIVASSGELLQVRLIEERSINSSLLRKIAVSSIQDASPFPPFPEGMDQYQIVFNVVLAFEEDN
ncbi:MAG: TonB C-terminal domain-containing protein [Candidatus Omnitrophica bacterium]|nr:TonB C-terminal domain-containing protein [Candidatus Omnitrophota bacterium]